MIKTIVAILAAILLLAAGAYLALDLGPAMLTSGRPELILLAWLLPFVWLVAVLFGYVTWADSYWSEEYDGLHPPRPPDPADTQERRGFVPAAELITGT